MIKVNIKFTSTATIKLLSGFSIVLLFAGIFYFDLTHYISMDFFLSEKKRLFDLYEHEPLLFIFVFFCVYIFCAAFSIPGAALLSLIAGFIFDFVIGSLVVSLASVIGAVCAFLISRFLMKDFVQRKFAKHLKTVNEGLKQKGAFYIFSLRLIPVFPFFLINILMGITPISIKQFAIGSFLGMLPGTFVYVNAGKQLSHISAIHQIFSVKVIVSFTLLALLPWIFKGLIRIYQKWPMRLKIKSFLKKLYR